MSDNIIGFPAARMLDAAPRSSSISAERVLSDAIGADLQTAFVVGICADGSLYIADTQEHFADTLLIVERAKQALMQHFIEDRLTSGAPPDAS